MFGMSSKEFWEDDPRLYWAYRTFYLKKREVEFEDFKYNAWLLGSINMLATSNAIANNFSKSNREYPKFEDLFGKKENNETNEKLSKKDINKKVQEENIMWARY